jgi:hypothetical protein
VKDRLGVSVGSRASIRGRIVLRRVGTILGVKRTMSILYFYKYSEEHGKEAVSRADDRNII